MNTECENQLYSISDKTIIRSWNVSNCFNPKNKGGINQFDRKNFTNVNMSKVTKEGFLDSTFSASSVFPVEFSNRVDGIRY